MLKTAHNLSKANNCHQKVAEPFGRRGLVGMLLGSVAGEVVTHAHCPPATVVR